jgi:hypothetical protein
MIKKFLSLFSFTSTSSLEQYVVNTRPADIIQLEQAIKDYFAKQCRY